MELVKIGKDKYLIKGSRGVIISEEERVKMGIIVDGKGCENCFKKKDNKKKPKSKKKEVKPEVEETPIEVIEEVEKEQPSESEVDADEVIEETTETI